MIRLHISKLDDGDLFRFRPDGEVFAVVAETDPQNGKLVRYLARPVDRPGVPASILEHGDGGCFVHPVESGEEGGDAS